MQPKSTRTHSERTTSNHSNSSSSSSDLDVNDFEADEKEKLFHAWQRSVEVCMTANYAELKNQKISDAESLNQMSRE